LCFRWIADFTAFARNAGPNLSVCFRTWTVAKPWAASGRRRTDSGGALQEYAKAGADSFVLPGYSRLNFRFAGQGARHDRRVTARGEEAEFVIVREE
jgi:hypothetical protein